MADASSEFVLEAHQVTKRYGSKTVLDHVSISLKPGEIFGFLGSNGAGKSTMMRLLMGLEKPDEGQLVFFGKPRDWHLNSRMAIVPQDDYVYHEFSVRENLLFFGRLNNVNGAVLQTRVKDLLEWLSLVPVANTRVEDLSGGYRKLVNIACSIVHDPAIIFLDEPTVALDVAMRQAVWRKLYDLRVQGKTLCLTTHYLDEARLLCDRIAILHKGKMLVNDTPRNLIENFGGKDIVRLRLAAGAAEAASSLAAEFPEYAVEAQKDEVVLVVPKRGSFDAMARISTFLAGRNHSIVASTVKEPAIDEVFLSLTGEKAE